MKLKGEGYQVAVVGASALLGKELLEVLKGRRFPVARLAELDAGGNPELPPVDLEAATGFVPFSPETSAGEMDFTFVAARPSSLPAFLEAMQPGVVIDLEGSLAEAANERPRIAFLDASSEAKSHSTEAASPQVVACAHPATLVLSILVLRLAARFELSTAVANIFSSASQHGLGGIEELQKQAVNLLSFQKMPRAVFGAQLAFNMLPRLAGTGSAALGGVEDRVRAELSRCLAGRAPVPALRFFQAPVFYSMAISLYVGTKEAITARAAAQALAGEPLRLRGTSEPPASQAEVTGSAEILLDSIVASPGRERGLWIWAAADDLRLAAQNAVQIAEQFAGQPAGTAREHRSKAGKGLGAN